ncbi:MAG TPA: helix-turn-helix domain-containing protein [Tepidiformaceae bacterium]|jgi:excisionase family DNA binding protein|nr:helix-turn-helix domain-containing protein [Thermoflexaceae bacterium]HMS57625.1 helix-turn-helix domain-containing protein [Tepidiformaceae bacterium]
MADSGRPAAQNWLTLGAASELLGVSESTIRRWADAGDVGSYRTRGGHRRILEEDLRQLVSAQAGAPPSRDTDRISDIAIGRIKRRISRGRQGHTTTVFERLSDDARERLRLLGRQLVDLFARYVASNTKGERFTEDAHTLGREYGRTLVLSGVGLTAAVQTFNAMRRSLEETASQIAAEAGLNAEDAVEAVEATLGLADTILEAMAEVYEQQFTVKS